MGFAKDRMMEQQDHGYTLQGFASVCQTCVGDYALAKLVKASAVSTSCDFCEAESDVPIAADVDTVLTHMGDSFYAEFDDAVNTLPVDEGEFVGTTYLIDDLLDAIDWRGNSRFRELVLTAFADGHYSRRDPFAIGELEALRLGWREFVETVVTTARFTFTLAPEVGDEDAGYPVLRGGAMLRNLGSLLREYELYRDLPEAQLWWRARRVGKRHDDYLTAADLGSPPSRKAKPNRMSPAGIPMFYGSNDEDAALAEVLAATGGSGADNAMVATFETTAPGVVVDLTDVPRTPSLFDEANRDERARLRFLVGFAFDVSRPLSPTDEQQTEYVPTQIVCEYLRHHFRTREGQRPIGLMFSSARDHSKTNVVYFVGPEGCLESDSEPATHTLQLRLRSVVRRVV